MIVPEVFMPLEAATKVIDTNEYEEIALRSANVGVTSEVAESVREVLRAVRSLLTTL